MLETCSETKKLTINDYPSVKAYLDSKFKVDISDIPIFLFPANLIKKHSLNNAAGFFVKFLKSIYIKNKEEQSNTSTRRKDAFTEAMKDLSVSVLEEDVVVHECLHAVSFKLGRKTNQYKHLEESFVYTNSVDFYKNKGYSQDYIVQNIFLPFCVEDVIQFDFKRVVELLADHFRDNASPIDSSLFFSQNNKTRVKMLNKYAKQLVTIIKKEAEDKGHKMILLNEKYKFDGSVQEHKPDKMLKRFSQIDFVDEIF